MATSASGLLQSRRALYDRGEGVPKDLAKELALYDRACKLDMPRACYNLAIGYEEGDLLPKDLPRAAELYRGACTA
jgi:TPR repeat protein